MAYTRLKEGDKVVIRWPQRSQWHDTMDGIHSGTINQHTIYTIKRIYPDRGGYSVDLNIGWGLGIEALDKYPKSRKLPDWF